MNDNCYKILIAEDEKNLRDAVKDTLEDTGHTASLAEDGNVAYAKLCENAQSYDLLLLDVQMPGMTGLELIDKLKERQINLPVLIMTGFGDKKTLKEIIKRGCDSYIDKPFNPKELLKNIDETVERFRENKRNRNQELDAIREENLKISRIVDIYRNKYEDLNNEVNRAVNSYTNLVSIDAENCNAPIAWRQRQLTSLGGDYLGVNNTEAGCDMIVADVAGHDMAASYHAVVVKSLFAENEHNQYDGETFMKILNALILNKGKNQRMITAMFLSLNTAKREVEVTAAGHPYMMIIKPIGDKHVMFPSEGSDPVGLKKEVRLLKRMISVSQGDRVLMFSDGLLNVAEINGETGDKNRLSRASIMDFATRHRYAPLTEMIEGIWAETLMFCRRKINDDMLLAAIEIP